jgi:phospholipase C
VYTIPPSSVRTIGDALLEKNISWAYYGDQWNRYLKDPFDLNPADAYCNICNFEQYATSIMTNAAVRATHLLDTADLYTSIANGTLPAVSYVKPSGLVDGHPASSKLILFEGFVKKIVEGVKANPKLWAETAIISPSMRVAAPGIRATSSRLISSATAPAFRLSWCRHTARAATSLTTTRIMSRR